MKAIYLIKDNDTNYYKIGISGNPEKRFNSLNSSNPNHLQLIYHSSKRKDARLIEKHLHTHFKQYKVPHKEWFNITEEDVKFIIHQIECVISIYEEKERFKI